jgi:hypothetical protein
MFAHKNVVEIVATALLIGLLTGTARAQDSVTFVLLSPLFGGPGFPEGECENNPHAIVVFTGRVTGVAHGCDQDYVIQQVVVIDTSHQQRAFVSEVIILSQSEPVQAGARMTSPYLHHFHVCGSCGGPDSPSDLPYCQLLDVTGDWVLCDWTIVGALTTGEIE